MMAVVTTSRIRFEGESLSEEQIRGTVTANRSDCLEAAQGFNSDLV